MDYKKLRDTRNSSNPFAQRLGIFVEEIGPGYARAVKDITAEDANPVGVAHGGCYFSLADTACGSAMASHGYYAVTVNASYNFLRSAKLGDHLVAEARETKPGRTLCFYEVEIRRGRCWGTGPSPSTSWTGRSRCEKRIQKDRPSAVFLHAYFLKLSFKLTDRLNTRWPGLESLLSTQK